MEIFIVASLLLVGAVGFVWATASAKPKPKARTRRRVAQGGAWPATVTVPATSSAPSNAESFEVLRGDCGTEFIVDTADVARVSAHKWVLVARGPGTRQTMSTYSNGRRVGLKAFILGRTVPEAGYVRAVRISHINGDPFDFRRCNLQARDRV